MYDSIKVEKFIFSTYPPMALKIKLVRPQSKGMVTIPTEFRRKLGIDENSLLEVKIVDRGVFFVKVPAPNEDIELYSDEQIAEWLKEDRLDTETAQKVKRLLKKK